MWRKKVRELSRSVISGPRVIAVVCMIVGILAFAGEVSSSSEQEVVSLRRPDGTAGSELNELTVIRENGERVPLKINLETRRISEQEAEERFREVLERIPEMIRGANPSLGQIRTDLTLPDAVEDLGVYLVWESQEPGVISSSGRLREGRQLSEPKEVCLSVTLRVQEYRREEMIRLVILPEGQPSWEERLQQVIAEAEENSRADGVLALPAEFEGEKLVFAQQEDISRQAGLALMPAVAGLLLLAGKEQKADKQKKKRQEAIAEDYPELIVKMTVLYQAGLSMRGVWERISADARRSGRKMRPIYEEVCLACNSMADGLSEVEAYRQFGRRCCTSSCLKLGNLLAGNVRRGTRQLSELMAQESARAWEQRKHRARRSGEKAGTKMLLPMFMMFGVVLAIVVIPAFYSFMI